jgi:hypothetical protein
MEALSACTEVADNAELIDAARAVVTNPSPPNVTRKLLATRQHESTPCRMYDAELVTQFLQKMGVLAISSVETMEYGWLHAVSTLSFMPAACGAEETAIEQRMKLGNIYIYTTYLPMLLHR